MAAGLSREGFTPLTYDELIERITARLEAYNAGFDVSAEAPDGQILKILSFEMALLWTQLGKVHYSYNPMVAEGDGLKNIGLITGIPYGVATRSQATIGLVGTAGTPVVKGSIVTDALGNEFATQFKAVIPANVLVIAKLSGPIAMPASTLTTIKSSTPGWTSITQALEGRTGAEAQTEEAYRNIRNRTVLRNFTSVSSTIRARLLELGIEQSTVFNNDTSTQASDGTPVGAIHVTVGDTNGVSDDDIARTILLTSGLGTATYGTTNINVTDSQGVVHIVNFDKAVAIDVEVNINLTYLSPDSAGAEEAITAGIMLSVNALLAGDDVIWSRLFGLITPHGKAQVNTLTVGVVSGTPAAANLVINTGQFAVLTADNINIVEA